MVRELVFYDGESDAVVAFAARELGLSGDLLEDFMHILRCPPALRQARLPEHLQEIISRHYRSAWLVCEHSSPAFTKTGSKPGIPLADLLFIVAFTRANHIIHADLIKLGLISKLPWTGTHELQQRQPQNYSTSLLCDTSYADDYMLAMLIFDCSTAIQVCKVTFSVIFRNYTTFGFVVNMKKGKSAAMFCLRGAGKRQVEFELYNVSDYRIDFDAGHKKQSLHVALEYKHLGCYLQHNGAQSKEFKFRSAVANSSISLLRRKVFSRAAISQRTKSTVTQAISFSQLYFSQHTASLPVPSINKGYEAVHIRVCKAVIGWKPDTSWKHITSDKILAQAALPSFSCFTSAARLRYLARVFAVGPDLLHALVEIAAPLPNSWHRLVWSDIAFLRSITDDCPATDSDLFDFVRNCPSKWRSLVKRSFSLEV